MADNKNNTGHYNTGDYNTGHYNTGDYNTGHRNTGDYNTGHRNTGHHNTGHRNTGHHNTGDYNTGIFNTNEPKMRAFNRDCDLTQTEFRQKHSYGDLALPLTEWIDKSRMTDAEKKEHPEFGSAGGFLRSLSYKEAWAKAWRGATDKQKQWYLDLPNFDADIFFEVTGIDVRKPTSLVGQTATVEIGGKKYTAVIQSEV